MALPLPISAAPMNRTEPHSGIAVSPKAHDAPDKSAVTKLTTTPAAKDGSHASKDDITHMLGDLQIHQYRKAPTDARRAADRVAFEAQLKRLAKGYISKKTLLNFEIQRVLGQGSFGRVFLVNEKGSPEALFACKVISKLRAIKKKQVEHTINEKNLLFCTSSKFIVHLHEYFQDRHHIYLLLDFANGGELFNITQKLPTRRYTSEQAKFITGETILALEYLHNLDIAYRDLKPENMLLDRAGHTRLTDFGFAKRVYDKTWTFCGTPEYLAPEIILHKGYGHSVDWWAVGVLFYELLSGRSPFENKDQMLMFFKIVKRDMAFPRHVTESERALIDGLLELDLTKRLGCMHGGVRDIKDSACFAGLDWEQMEKHGIAPPFVPPRVAPAHAATAEVPHVEELWDNSAPDEFGDVFMGF